MDNVKLSKSNRASLIHQASHRKIMSHQDALMKQLIETSISPKLDLNKLKYLPITPIGGCSRNSHNAIHSSYKKSNSLSQSKRLQKSSTCFSAIASVASQEHQGEDSVY